MEKLELKHLAAYLPYGLKWQVINKGSFTTSPDTIEIAKMTMSNISSLLLPKAYRRVSCKPILRPLSDLTKEIEVNGEKFMPMEKLYKHWVGTHTNNQINQKYFSEIMERLSKYDDCKHIHYCIVENLFKWHFDIFELIHKNLAIDINTLKL